MAAAKPEAIRGIKDWDSGADAAIAALQRAEAAVFGEPGKARRYRRAGRLLVASDLVGSNIPGWPMDRQLKAALPGIGHSPLRVQMSLVNVGEVELGCSADVVLFKAHLRGFYLDRQVTIKIPNPGRATAAERFRHEVDLRKSLRDTADVFVPGLHAVPGENDDVFVAEKMVAGDELPPAYRDEVLASQLMAFYAANGLRAQRLADHFDFDKGWAAIRTLCERISVDIPAAVARWAGDFAGSGRAGGGEVLCAPCNGDLTRTNLLSVGERICIIDWEYLNHGPVCRDVIRLSTQRRRFQRHWLKALQEASASHGPKLLEAGDQMLAGAFMVIIERMERELEFCDPASRAAYRERMKGRVGKILQLCDGVPGATK